MTIKAYFVLCFIFFIHQKHTTRVILAFQRLLVFIFPNTTTRFSLRHHYQFILLLRSQTLDADFWSVVFSCSSVGNRVFSFPPLPDLRVHKVQWLKVHWKCLALVDALKPPVECQGWSSGHTEGWTSPWWTWHPGRHLGPPSYQWLSKWSRRI